MLENLRKKIIGKKGLELEMLGWWILAIAGLLLMVIAYLIFRNKGLSSIKFIENIFRLRGG